MQFVQKLRSKDSVENACDDDVKENVIQSVIA